MRRSVSKTVAVAAATLALIAGAGFVIQVAVLGRPGPGPLLVVRAVAHLASYHSSSATMTVRGRQVATSCTQTWQQNYRAARVVVDDGRTLLEVHNGLRQRGALDIAEFELAGCPRPLTKWLATQLDRGERLVVQPALLFGRPVYRVAFPTAQLKLQLYVTRVTAFPVALSIAAEGVTGISQISYPFRLPWFLRVRDL